MDIEWIHIRSPGDIQSVRRFVDKHRANVNGYERIRDKTGHIAFMLGKETERGVKFVAGIQCPIWEFADKTEERLRSVMGMDPKEPDQSALPALRALDAMGGV